LKDHLQASASIGNVIGPGTTALQWPSYALVILCCWQDICAVLGTGTLPPVHTAITLMRKQSTGATVSSSRPGPAGHLAKSKV